MRAVRKVCSAMLSGLSTPAISQPVRLDRLSRPISYRKFVSPSSSGFGISWPLNARLRRQVALAGQRLDPGQELGGKLVVLLENAAAPLNQRPGGMYVQVSQWFTGHQAGGEAAQQRLANPGFEIARHELVRPVGLECGPDPVGVIVQAGGLAGVGADGGPDEVAQRLRVALAGASDNQ